MEIFWFCAVAVMIAMYVVLDGFDLGAGIVHLVAGKNAQERGLILRSIGPVWDGNEVWLLAGGGTLYFAFPALYASSFSGFYLPLMVVLWLLILRGISVEFRNHIDSPVWRPLWDVVFSFASGLLTIFFGAALGNVVRGVPLSADGHFFLPFWTNFRTGQEPGILDWYTVTVGLAAFFTLMMHGALWISMKTDGAVERRAGAIARHVWWAVLGLTIAITLMSFSVQPQLSKSFSASPWGYVFPFLATAGLVASRVLKGHEAFLASCLFIVGMLTSAAFGVFPYVLPSSANPEFALTVYNAAAPDYGLRVGLMWFIPGMLLVAAYFIYTYRNFAGKVRLDEPGY
jgi:cytochrome d ubiquinol oxidase subunit II